MKTFNFEPLNMIFHPLAGVAMRRRFLPLWRVWQFCRHNDSHEISSPLHWGLWSYRFIV